MVQQEATACGISDIGNVRKNNEDVWANLPEISCYILADGMGGHQAGEIAAKEAVDALCRNLKKQLKSKEKSLDEAREIIYAAIQGVNSHVYKLGKSVYELHGMGTTLCVLHFHKDKAILAHVGDSRIYREREGKLELMTNDHSLLSELKSLGRMTPSKEEECQFKNIITKAVGTEPTIVPSITIEELKAGDLYLLCSDGLSDLLSIEEMEEVLLASKSLSGSASGLVQLAKQKGGHDNVTVLLVKNSV